MRQSKKIVKQNQKARPAPKSAQTFADKLFPMPNIKGACLVHPDLQEFFGYALYKAALKMRSMMGEAFAPQGVIPPHFGIMTLLKIKGQVNQVNLGEAMNIDKATMVKLIDQLEKLKYVSRDASKEDRRVKFVSLTDKGLKAHAEMVKQGRVAEKDFMSPLSAAEEKQFRALLLKLVENARF